MILYINVKILLLQWDLFGVTDATEILRNFLAWTKMKSIHNSVYIMLKFDFSINEQNKIYCLDTEK